jgi:DNA repair exonuclease SbcCD ATPase subunit/predicted MPP superfamily phosphohydrolase
MRILAFSDLHITPKCLWSQPTEDGLSTYLHRMLDAADWICRIIKESELTGWDAVVFLGDICESVGYIDTVSLNVCYEVFHKIAAACTQAERQIPIISIVGNHDLYSTASNLHNQVFLKSLRMRNCRNIYVADKPGMFESGPQFGYHRDRHIYCLPYTDRYDTIQIPPEARLVLAHMDINGCQLSSQVVTQDALELDSSRIVLNGHYHNPSVKDTVINVGALFSRTNKDANSEPRGVVLIDFDEETGELRSFDRIRNYYDVPILDVELKSETGICELLDREDLDLCHVTAKFSDSVQEYLPMISERAFSFTSKPIDVNVTPKTVNMTDSEFSPYENLSAYLMGRDEPRSEAVNSLGRAYLDSVFSSGGTVMTPITVHNVTIHNFLSIDDYHLDLSNGIYVIDGLNGSGKSSMIEAINYAWTGKSLRDYEGDDIIRWGETESSVCSEATIGKERFKVCRYRNNPTHGTRAVLYQWTGDEYIDISARTGELTNKQIRELIGRSDRLLKHCAFLTGSLKDRFLGLSGPDRVKLLEEIANIDVYDRAYKAVDVRYKTLYQTRESTQISIKTRQDTEKSLTERLAFLADKRVKLAESESVRQARDCKEQLESERSRLYCLEKSLEQSQEELKLISRDETEAREALHSLRSVLVTADRNITVRQEAKRSILNRMDHMTALVKAGKCPLCGQAVTDKVLDKEEVDRLNAELSTIDDELEVLQLKHDRTTEDVATATEELERINRCKLECERTQHSISSERREARHRLETLESRLTALEGADTELIKLEAQIVEVERTLQANSQNLVEDLANLDAVMADLGLHESLLKAFGTSGIRAMIMDSYVLSFLNKRLAHYSESFCLPIRMTAECENKKGVVSNKIDVVVRDKKYGGCSSGQRRAIDLAIQCAISDLCTSVSGGINILVLDEVLDTLDMNVLQAFLETVRSAAATQAVLAVSHLPFLQIEEATKINVTAVDGVSRYRTV